MKRIPFPAWYILSQFLAGSNEDLETLNITHNNGNGRRKLRKRGKEGEGRLRAICISLMFYAYVTTIINITTDLVSNKPLTVWITINCGKY